jgi:uncharacterized membrane protein
VSADDAPAQEVEKRRTSQRENRLPTAAAVVAVAAIYALLPSEVLITPRFVVPAVELLLLIPLLAANPRRMLRRQRWTRVASIVLSAIVIITNMVALVMMITTLGKPSSGIQLLVGAMQIWITNVIGFALLYWEIDRGGPVARHELPRKEMPAADWRFSQDENSDTVTEVAATASQVAGWVPNFVDYFYLSLTNSTAFSPTDTMPLSSRAKLLMGLEATTALFTTLILIARAVGALGS